MTSLLAIDLGLKAGLALYGEDGRLQWYRSKNFGSASRLKKGVRTILFELPDLTHLIVEGGGSLADIWLKEAERRDIITRQVHADVWRQDLLIPRDRRSGDKAKQIADGMARRVIVWSGLSKPTSLRHDAAEAILIGLWAVIQLSWLDGLPDALR